MIFFMTIIIPPSNASIEISRIQKLIFKEFKLIPTPIPLLVTKLQIKKPQKPTRKKLADTYPSTISFNKYDYSDNGIILKINESIPLNIDEEILFYKEKNRGMIISTIIDGKKENLLHNIPYPQISTFSNYSLACLKMKSNGKTPFWLNIEWEKIWEVKKGKNNINKIS